MNRLRLLRVALAALLFSCVNLCFFGLSEGAAVVFGFQLLPALLGLNAVAIAAILIVTLVFGRIYCSTVCPMGVFQDLAIWLFRRVRGRRPPRARILPAPPKALRFVFLTISALLIALGFVSLGALFDGYSLYGRIATQIFKPAYSSACNLLASALCEAGHPCLIREEVFVRGACALSVALAGLAGVAVLVWWRGRLFCNTLCPVGALLALVSKRPLFRVTIDKARCVKCGLCSASCACGAIDCRHATVDDSACVRCFNCLSSCRKHAISFRPARTMSLRESFKCVENERM